MIKAIVVWSLILKLTYLSIVQLSLIFFFWCRCISERCYKHVTQSFSFPCISARNMIGYSSATHWFTCPCIPDVQATDKCCTCNLLTLLSLYPCDQHDRCWTCNSLIHLSLYSWCAHKLIGTARATHWLETIYTD